MGLFRKVSGEVSEGLTEEVRQEYKELAKQWNKTRPPKDIQIK